MTRNTGPSQRVREIVKARDNNRCVVCGKYGENQFHHRQPRKMGGTRRPGINLPSNLLTLCVICHQYAEAHRTTSYRLGLLVREPSIPSGVPVLLLAHGWVLLDDDGLFVPTTPPTEGAA